ncbi:MAG: DEAD/DEAH box helicase family protein, partial [Fibrobacteraceae bacterium]|nr:DEAD/DEAH box helicase family protein [Fibrobacteraceae bacterium]
MSSSVTQIKTMRPVNRAIYAYTTPNDKSHDGWIKIGDTEVNIGENLNKAVSDRVKQQTHTSNTFANIEWTGKAEFEDDSTPFRDYDFHKYLTNKQDIERKPKTEWFKTDATTSKNHFRDFKENHGILTEMEGVEIYELRDEQEEAVRKTANYFDNHKLVKILKKDKAPEFLWNAKPRFGKTLTAYDFCKRVNARNVLILTNRPAIADSWYSDYARFVGTEGGYYFVSQVDVFKKNPQRYKHVLTREEFTHAANKERLGCIEFISLQDLKGAKAFGGDYEKLREVSELDWDVLILDEAHEGVETDKTDVALERIKRRFTLNLSGTPFKMLASDKFPEEAIFNWTYADEQERKREFAEKGVENPYEDLPKLNLFTYQMSDMMGAKANAGTLIDDEETQYYFDLNEFFKTNASGYFEHLDDVKKFLDTLTDEKCKKYPFSTEELRNQLKHTFWLLNRVDSAIALKKLLTQHPVFKEYTVVLAVGNGDEEQENQKAITAVREA